jgi:predicted GNAT family N-acyltransferase
LPEPRILIVTHDWERFDELLELSYSLLYGPFGVAREDEWYVPAHGSEFAVALAEDGGLLGTARLLPAAGDESRQVRQVVVREDAQSLGVGRMLMDALHDLAAAEGASAVWLRARSSALGFYERLGYEPEGEEFISELTGIPHVQMRKRLR